MGPLCKDFFNDNSLIYPLRALMVESFLYTSCPNTSILIHGKTHGNRRDDGG